jgi:hypothetical protein
VNFGGTLQFHLVLAFVNAEDVEIGNAGGQLLEFICF